MSAHVNAALALAEQLRSAGQLREAAVVDQLGARLAELEGSERRLRASVESYRDELRVARHLKASS